MNRIQRWLVRFTARFVPQLGRMFEQAGGTMERLQETVQMYRERESDRQERIHERMEEIREAMAMQGGQWLGGGPQAVPLKEGGAVVKLRERLAELELALEDRGWKRQLALATSEFSRYGIQQIILICRLMRIKNPLIQRGILVSAYYVFGRGVEVTSEDDTVNEVLQDFFTDPRNTPAIGHAALVKKECSKYTDGNIFWTLFTDVSDGKCVVRTIDPVEIDEIVTDPDDAGVPWYYHRIWAQTQFDPKTGIRQPVMQKAWYVAMGFTPPAGLKEIRNEKIMVDGTGQFIEVLHDKDGDLEKWLFGCPRAYAAIDWARASKDLLTDYATRMRALARFSWDLETKGGAPAIANFKQTFATTLASDGTNIEQNPPPVTGSAWISGPGTKLTPIKTAGSVTGPDEANKLFRMVYMVFGLGEHFFADISTGNLATATSLDRPTELKFLTDQKQWEESLTRLCTRVVERSKTAPKGKLREAIKEGKYKADAPIQINVNFPPIVEGDIPALMGALVEAITLNGFEPTGIDEKTGIKAALSMVSAFANIDIDVEEVIEEMYPDATYKPLQDRTPLMKFQNEQALNPPDPTAPGAQGGEGPTGAAPHAPQARKPHPRKIDASTTESAKVLTALRQVLTALKERKKAS
jgi:hypothetical protein